jgi:mRNA interferase RelE/StbE
MTKLYLTNTVQKKFLKLPKNIQSRIDETIKEIFQNPNAGKKLMGELEGEYTYRIGKYRIIYYLDEMQNIWIETVSHRKDVYRKK